MNDEVAAPEPVEYPAVQPLEALTIHAIRSKMTEAGHAWKPSDKKADMIKVLNGTFVKPAPKEKGKPTLQKSAPIRAKVAELPDEIMPQLREMEKKGLTWVIDHENCGVTFMRDLPSYTSLDSSALNILLAARVSFAGKAPIERGA